jgi:uncharacterized protein (UPF0335 family)
MNNFIELDESLYDHIEQIEKMESEKIQLGKDVEGFFSSKIGKYILAKIERESDQAIQSLITCEPSDQKKISQCQNDIRVVNSIKNWLIDAYEEAQMIETNKSI